jgi:hypothetical protein
MGLSFFYRRTAMPSTQQAFADPDPQNTALGPVDAAQEDDYWRRVFWCERYYRPGLDYEDYAPAYCVGYIGYAQYGGDYEDAETSLCANWERIKGDSRLPLDGARQAMRAAWDRMAAPAEASAMRPARRALVPAGQAMHAAPG